MLGLLLLQHCAISNAVVMAPGCAISLKTAPLQAVALEGLSSRNRSVSARNIHPTSNNEPSARLERLSLVKSSGAVTIKIAQPMNHMALDDLCTYKKPVLLIFKAAHLRPIQHHVLHFLLRRAHVA